MSALSKIPLREATRLLFLLLLAKAIATLLFWFLPLEGVEPKREYSFENSFVRVDLARSFGFKRGAKRVEIKPKVAVDSGAQFVLKGLYGNKQKGFAVVAKKQTSKTKIIGIGEAFEGYVLRSILQEGALFTKEGKEYLILLQKPKQSSKGAYNLQKVSATTQESEQDTLRVADGDVRYFASHPQEIWKNISIKEKLEGGRIVGFEIKWINPKSKFAKLGLKRGDLIIKANDKELRSYKDALDIYKQIGKLDTVAITILRENQEREIIYEIDR